MMLFNMLQVKLIKLILLSWKDGMLTLFCFGLVLHLDSKYKKKMFFPQYKRAVINSLCSVRLLVKKKNFCCNNCHKTTVLTSK